MGLLVGIGIFILAAIAITYKILLGYTGFSWPVKVLSFLFILVLWFAPFLVRLGKRYALLDGYQYAICSKIGYTLAVFAVLLFVLLLARDILWHITYFISSRNFYDPNNAHYINRANFVSILIALGIVGYGVYQAYKVPNVNLVQSTDARILKDTKIVVASDFHIDQSTPVKQVQQIVDTINAQNPDYILLLGDLVDDIPANIEKQLNILSELKAKKIFLSLGNHEFYHEPAKWMIAYTLMGFDVLHNNGETVEDTGLFITAFPDPSFARPNVERALNGAAENSYKILMTHTPVPVRNLKGDEFDFIVAGHTHGGQIYPFHYPVEAANGYLAGLYNLAGGKIYITRGAGFWGPPMRLLAPSDITVLELKALKND